MAGKNTVLCAVSKVTEVFYSLLLNRAQWAAYHQTGRGINMQAGENLPLQILFWQVCRLLSLPIKPVVVFDGPNKPEFKRGRKVKSTPHALMLAYQQLIRDAGFITYVVSTLCILTWDIDICQQAPGEAEAELSQLNARGEIDAVMSDDADTFIFGATHVIRMFVYPVFYYFSIWHSTRSNVVKDGDCISIFMSSAIWDHPKIQLTPPRILLIAILSGGDYTVSSSFSDCIYAL